VARDPIREARQAAKSCLQTGDVDGAVRALVSAGDVEEASQLLLSKHRFAEAGQVLMSAIRGVRTAADIRALDATGKKYALKAAICFDQAGKTKQAVDLFLALGERHRAVLSLKKAGDEAAAARLEQADPAQQAQASAQVAAGLNKRAGLNMQAAQRLETTGNLDLAMQAYIQLRQFAHAGRMAHALGKMEQAAELFSDGAMPYEAAVCYLKLGNTGKSLEKLTSVPREDKRYRAACLQAIQIASELSVLDFQLEHFLAKFAREAPKDEQDLEAFYKLSTLYQRHDFIENARDMLEKIVAVNPEYRDARARLAAIDAETRGSPMVYERILKEEAAFRGEDFHVPRGHQERGAPEMRDLPDLPDLPDPAAGGFGPAGRQAPPPPAPPPFVAEPPPPPFVAEPPLTVPDAAPAPPPIDLLPITTGVLDVGAIVSGRYRIEKKIGQGGMGAVFKATDLELEEVIAMKVFTNPADDGQLLERFKRELLLSRQLNHNNIVRLYDIGAHAGMRFITMELLSGRELRSYMTGPMPIGQAIEFLLQACAGLQAAHDKGIIHRDVKPENFFITEHGVLKVMDFGIAKRQTTKGLTVAGMIAGTPEYISPEQINDFGSVSAATDLYALGIIAYELFTGTVPFTAEELMNLLMMHLTEPPTPLRSRNPEVPEHVEAIVLKLLEKKPADRYASCNALARALIGARDRLATEGQL
jgi:eukaryotic-like serine/threonine-protein kinase